ncbi:hypothetical protein BBO99_00003241 [Phytophthora kernoviae]|uniref:sarcosine oxidasee (formaldehyde-forming) n=1 Tax=Phytophthora kernoviae TaxID=325452 RepID=A0A3R7HYS1_9STRA|nr:hypothetical protein BBI17_003243 [Phytophthora kernoviae]RLN81983.1 hypothetical protein BBO99_00003241 [Phytophthora kernoviae]
MEPSVYDVVVIGAGLMGSSAAYHAAKAGKRVLLLEQFELLHGQGSSHGSSRIFRVAYPEDVYTNLCLSSLKMWREIEKEGGVELIQTTGALDFASERIDELRNLENALAKHHVPFEVLTGAQVNKRFPGFSLDDNSHAVWNPTAGVLDPTLAMATMHRLAKEMGTEIRERCPVKNVFGEQQTDGSTLAIVVLADGTSVRGHQCIVTAGPWTDKVLGESRLVKGKLQPIATFGTYWKCKQELYTPDKFPVFIKYGHPMVYGLPMMNPHEGVKICRHDGPSIDPDTRKGVTQPATELQDLQSFVAKNFSNVDSSVPNQVDDCMYTMTPEEHFILDFVVVPPRAGPERAYTGKKIVVGAGFSGHGAKMTPVIGPFSDRQRILVVGDGDFSFSLALAVFLGGKNIVATCYDSKMDLKEKYSNALLNCDALETAGAEVHFDVDATYLEQHNWLDESATPFQSIVFNFPHLGGATEEDVVNNQKLLREFFYSTRKFLHPTRGQVLVSLRNTLFYNRWQIQEQAAASGLKLKRTEPFDANIYSGYEPQRTHPASFRGEPPSTTGAHYFIFALDKSIKAVDPRQKSAQGPVKKKAANAPLTKMDCKACGLTFRDVKKYNGHMNSAKHAKKVKAMKKKH